MIADESHVTPAYWAQLSDRSFAWLVTSGFRVVLIAVAMVLLMALLRRGVAQILRASVSNRAVPTQVKRTMTLTNIIRDVARIAIVFVPGPRPGEA